MDGDAITKKGLIETWSHRAMLPALVIIGITVLAYLPAFDAGYVFDDAMYLTGNSRMGTLDGLRGIWMDVGQPDYRHQYYPLTSSALWVQHQLWGGNPFGYHFVNVLLHALNAILLWRLLRMLKVPGAWIAGAIFAVHPVHVQSVAWISELKNVLSTFFFLLSANVLVRWFGVHRGGAVIPRSHLSSALLYGLGALLFVCALLSKTATALLPVALLLVLWWKRDTIGRRDALGMLPLVVIGASAVLMTVYLETHGGASGELYAQTLLERCLIAGRSVWFYAGKLAWPVALSLIYPRWTVDTGAWWQSMFPVAVVATVAALWLLRGRVGKGPLVAVCYFILAVAPISFVNVAFTRFSYVADHWQYWGSMGLIALGTAVFCGSFLKPRDSRLKTLLGWLRVPVAVSVLGALSIATWQRSHVFTNEWTLWSDTLQKNPTSWQAHYNVGIALAEAGSTEEAVRHYRAALRLEPEESVVHNNLGIALCALGHHRAGLAEFEEAVRLAPRSPQAQVNLGEALISEGRVKEGMRHYHEAMRAIPRFAGAHFNMGITLRAQGRLDEAIAQFREALRISPDAYEVHNSLGEAFLAAARPDEAIRHYRESLRLRPEWAAAHFNLAIALESQDRLNEAISHYRQALWSEPEIAEVHYRLGGALHRAGRSVPAIKHLRYAVSLKPGWSDAWRSLAWVLATTNDPDERDAHEAVDAALKAIRLAGRSDARNLDVLAAAYAGAGRFDEAVPAAMQALTLAATTHKDDLAADLEDRLELYARRTPYRWSTEPPERARTAQAR